MMLIIIMHVKIRIFLTKVESKKNGLCKQIVLALKGTVPKISYFVNTDFR